MRLFDCPNCDAHLKCADDRDVIYCEYCGEKIDFRDFIDELFDDSLTEEDVSKKSTLRVNKYRVFGSITATISKDVWAMSKKEAYSIALKTFEGVDTYGDNAIGVSGRDEYIEGDGDPIWEMHSIMFLETADVRKCPSCGRYVELSEETYRRSPLWYCDDCEIYFNKNEDWFEYDFEKGKVIPY